MAASIDAELDAILQRDTRYAREAYRLVIRALSNLAKRNSGRHFTAKELLAEIKECALRAHWTSAPENLRSWGVNSSRDFGVIVYNLIDHKIMRRDVSDSLDDFNEGIDFGTDFPKPFYKEPVFFVACLVVIGLIVWALVTNR